MTKASRRQGFTFGFTLIELLVVISIIALLASIVLASLATARNKAQDAAKQELVKSFINALAEYSLDNNGAYPLPNSAADGSGTKYAENLGRANAACLEINSVGVGGNDCSAGNGEGNDAQSNAFLNSALNGTTQYIQTPAGGVDNISALGMNVGGVDYTCVTASSGQCQGYVISWFYSGINSNCDGGKDETALTSRIGTDTTNTYCAYGSDPTSLTSWEAIWGEF